MNKLQIATQQSEAYFISIDTNPEDKMASDFNSIERDIYFIMNSTNYELFKTVSSFGQKFTNEKIDAIG